MNNTFKGYNLKSTTLDFIKANGFEAPTPIQAKVIPPAIKGKDIIGIAKTGTGKTHAFLIPIIEMIDPSNDSLQVVITAPTRELAAQLVQRARLIKDILPEVRVVEAIGGSDRSRSKNNPHILIGTPGRILDLVIEKRIYRVDKVKMLIIDEADMTLDFGFLNDVDKVASQMPKTLQMMVFGATIPNGFKPFLKKYLQSPITINCDDDHYQPKIEHILVPCLHNSYVEQLLQILPGFQPYVCLIFANTRNEAVDCARTLRANDYQVVEIHGDLQPRERKQVLRQLSNHQHTYVVATDLAARGIDIESITHVVSLGFPSDLDFYLHRAGRTGRAGKEGVCFALFKENDLGPIKQLKARGIKFTKQRYRNNQWRVIKEVRRTKPKDEWEIEIAKIVTKKNEKVKPGYKKKRQEEIDRLKRKKRRAMIQESINQLKKAKNKQKQIEKGKAQ